MPNLIHAGRRTLRGRAALPGVLALLMAAVPALAADLHLRILETSDVHMHLLSFDYYQDKPSTAFGLDRTLPLITAARAQARNSLLIDNGDLLQGNPMGDWVATARRAVPGSVHPAYTVLNAIGVDAANLGNHEFNFGLPFLRQSMAGAAFPYVCANVFFDDGDGNPGNDAHAFTPYVILQRQFTDEAGARHLLRIGVIGFVPPQILSWDRRHLQGRLTVGDMVETARRLVPRLRAEGADLVIAVPHGGFEPSPQPPMGENMVGKLARVPGIDVLLFGHAHAEFPGPLFARHPGADITRGTIHGIPAVMPGRWGDHLGVVDLVLRPASAGSPGPRWQVVQGSGRLQPITDRTTRRPLTEPDPLVARLLAGVHAATQAHMRAPVGRSATPLVSYFAQVADDPSVQIVARAQLAYARRGLAGTPQAALPLVSAAAPFKAGGRQGWADYTDIPAGTLTLGHVADLYVYPNTLKAVEVSGATLREWLERSAAQFRRIDPTGPAVQELLEPEFRAYNFDMIEGLQYTIDVTQPARYDDEGRLVAPDARRIVGLRLDGQALADDARVVVVTNSYRANGGGKFPGLDGRNIVLDAPDENRSALADYLGSAGMLDTTPDGNWRIQPVPGVSLRFRSGAGGIAHLGRYPQIRLVQDNGDGSATYELRP